jgi:hypothetical protein
MKQSRAQFKLALRYCKQHEDAMRADAYANNLAHKDYTAFWKDVKRSTCDKYSVYANTFGGYSGVENIAEMWMNHYKDL